MSLLVVCLFIALLMPILTKIPVAIAMHHAGGYNNKAPRSQQATLTGLGSRALASHQNSFEALIVFAPALVLAISLGKIDVFIQQLAVVHLGCRLAYSVFYLLNWDYLRSIFWAIGYLCPLLIVWQCMPS